jgi:fucokinase
LPPQCLVLAVPDPDGARIGSGGATLNAMFVASKALCSQAGHQDIHPEFLSTKRILVLHSGGDSQRIPICSVRGKAFCSLPVLGDGEPLSPIDFLLQQLHSLCATAPPGGVFVAATDVLLIIPPIESGYTWLKSGVTGFAVPGDVTLGSNHGVYVLEHDNDNTSTETSASVSRFLQKPTYTEMFDAKAIMNDERVLLDTGIVYFSAPAAQQFLSLAGVPPFDSCTLHGLDQGADPIRFELYTDLLFCMNRDFDYDTYMALPPSDQHAPVHRTRALREQLWSVFRNYEFGCCFAPGGEFCHVGTTAEYMELVVRSSRADDDDDSNAGASNHSMLETVPRKVYREFGLKPRARAFVQLESNVHPSAILVNTLVLGCGKIEAGAMIENSSLQGNFSIEKGALVSGVRRVAGLHVSADTVVQEQHLCYSRLVAILGDQIPNACDGTSYYVISVFGVRDRIKEKCNSNRATFLSMPWSNVFNRLSISADDIWPHEPVPSRRALWNARLFPILVDGKSSQLEDPAVLWLQHAFANDPNPHALWKWKCSQRLSFQDIIRCSDPLMELQWRRTAAFQVDLIVLEKILLERQNTSLLPIIRRWAGSFAHEMLQSLDQVASHSCSTDTDISARTLSAIGDVILAMPHVIDTNTVVRSGPSNNRAWRPLLSLLASTRATDRAKAVQSMADLRKTWIESDAQHAVRAVRHYDAACQVMISHCVKTAPVAISQALVAPRVQAGQWIHTSSPARIDLAGGWSDTPPISFERSPGGIVCNVAVRLDGQHPIGASARFIEEPIIRISMAHQRPDSKISTDSDATDSHTTQVICSSNDDFADCNNPQGSGALIKSALLCLGIVLANHETSQNSVPPVPLQQQLQQVLSRAGAQSHFCGIEIWSWTSLPTGTGLGVSSILAACVVESVSQLTGKELSRQSLIHMVLQVEQMMTTGGGWQDQVGGIVPGFKVIVSQNSLPLTVTHSSIKVPLDSIKRFNDHALLLYTGATRLAKNLLQTVIQRWYHRAPDTLDLFRELHVNTHQMSHKLARMDLDKVSKCLAAYWSQKKRLAAGAEPAHIAALCAKLAPFARTTALCGAGGGGFMVVILKQPYSECQEEILQVLADDMAPHGQVTVHRVQVCTSGMQTEIQQ